MEEQRQGGAEVSIEIPPGGPIYVPNLVGPLTRAPDFQSAVVRQLQNLEAALCLDSSQLCDYQVDDLKIFTEEELVNMALKEAFKDGNNPQNTSKKRKATDHVVEGSYIAKVEELAKLKQKQDEDKAAAAARLHSFNASCNPSERTERMKSLRSRNSASKQLKSSSNTKESITEVVLCVEVYHNKRKWVKAQELLVLGCQALTELRDKICCSTDQVMQKSGQHDPSGYFLIEDVFYNDLRDPSAIDYSEPIFDWLRNSKDDALRKWESINIGALQQKQKAIIVDVTTSDLPHFKAFDMHKLRFCDLRFRLGAGYLYCHQGACKHIIVIRDMRLIHPEDVHDRAAYPIVIFQLKLRPQKCNVCKIYRASKVVLDDKWTPENPCHFCDYCYSLLHSKNGPPLYSDYTVYDYLHD